VIFGVKLLVLLIEATGVPAWVSRAPLVRRLPGWRCGGIGHRVITLRERRLGRQNQLWVERAGIGPGAPGLRGVSRAGFQFITF